MKSEAPLEVTARSRPARAAALVAVVTSIALGAACGDPNIPALSDLQYDGQAPDSSVVLLFTVDFADADGDLGEGELETYLNDDLAGDVLEMQVLFIASGHELDETQGQLDVNLQLALQSAALPDDGTRFDVGLRAVDAAGNASETVETTLVIRR